MIGALKEDDFQEWLLHPMTKLVVQWHKKLIEEAKEGWVSRDFTRPSIEETALVNAEALGKVQGIGMFVALTEGDEGYARLMEDLHDKP